jgi:uncharacterized protein (DUF1697 family)
LPETYVALLRGINVGASGRLAMADLRALLADLGYVEPKTVLNSGNVVFGAPAGGAQEIAERVGCALEERLGLRSRVVVLTAQQLRAAVRGNPLLPVATDRSRLLVAFLADPRDTGLLRPLAARNWSPEELAVGEGVAYLWCPGGVAGSALAQAAGKTLGDGVTVRSWATVMKLDALASAREI